MRYILVAGLLIVSFFGGIYFENSRLVGESDKTIAVMMSKQAIENSSFQINENSDYLSLIQSKDYEKLAERINSNSELLISIKKDAVSVCAQVECSDKQKSFIEGAKESGK